MNNSTHNIFLRSNFTKLMTNLWMNTSKVSCINRTISPNNNAFLTKTMGPADDHQLGSNSGWNSLGVYLNICMVHTKYSGHLPFHWSHWRCIIWSIIINIAVPVARPNYDNNKTKTPLGDWNPEIWMLYSCWATRKTQRTPRQKNSETCHFFGSLEVWKFKLAKHIQKWSLHLR